MSSNFFTRFDEEERRSPIRQVERASARRPTRFRDDGGGELNVKPAIGQPGRDDIQPLIDAFQGTPDDPLGADPRSAFDILRSGIPLNRLEERGILPSMASNLGTAGKAIGEGGHEIAELIGNMLSFVNPKEITKGALDQILADQGFEGGVEEIIRQAPGAFANVSKEVLEDLIGEGTPTTGADEPEDVDETRELVEELSSAVENQALLDAELEKELDPEQQEQIDLLRQQNQEEVLRLEGELAKVMEQRELQDMLLNREEQMLFGEEGLLPGVSEEEAEMLANAMDLSAGESPGLNPAVLSAIDAIMNSQLSAAEQEDRIDFVLDQAELKNEMLTTVQNITQNKRDIEELLSMTDVELLGSEADFLNPTLRFDLQFDPLSRTNFAVADSLEGYFETVTGSGIPSVVADQVRLLMDGVQARPGFENSPAFAQTVDAIAAAAPGVTAQGLSDAIATGLENGAARNEAWDQALDVTNFNPGSEMLAIALFQVAINEGVDPQMATMIAESQDLHRIIRQKSGGNVGASTGGNQFGIGGLTEEAYMRMGFIPEETVGDTAAELSALVRYIVDQFGTPDKAMNYWKRTGDWGS